MSASNRILCLKTYAFKGGFAFKEKGGFTTCYKPLWREQQRKRKRNLVYMGGGGGLGGGGGGGWGGGGGGGVVFGWWWGGGGGGGGVGWGGWGRHTNRPVGNSARALQGTGNGEDGDTIPDRKSVRQAAVEPGKKACHDGSRGTSCGMLV